VPIYAAGQAEGALGGRPAAAGSRAASRRATAVVFATVVHGGLGVAGAKE